MVVFISNLCLYISCDFELCFVYVCINDDLGFVMDILITFVDHLESINLKIYKFISTPQKKNYIIEVKTLGTKDGKEKKLTYTTQISLRQNLWTVQS